MRQIVLDTETTGLNAEGGDRIIEVGCVELFNRKLTGNNLHLYLNPERESHEDALRIHGLSSDFLREKPKFADVVQEILDYVAGAEIIIHNAAFDIGFLNRELERLNLSAFNSHVGSVTDTLAMAKAQYPGKRNSLDALCNRLGVDNSGRKLHGALLDAELLADVYINLTRGQDALLIDLGSVEAADVSAERVDLSAFVLPVLSASELESTEHEAVLAQIDNSSGGKTLWRAFEPQINAAGGLGIDSAMA